MEAFINKDQFDAIYSVLSSLNNSALFWLNLSSVGVLLVTAIFSLKSARASEKSAKLAEEAIRENRKEGYLENMPIIKATLMARRKNERSQGYYASDPAAQDERSRETVRRHTEHQLYQYENIGKSIANIELVELWVGNALADRYKLEINDQYHKKVLYAGEKDEIAYGSIYDPEEVRADKFPVQIRITYSDIWGHKIIYTASKRGKLSPRSLPFVGIDEYIEHKYEYPSELRWA